LEEILKGISRHRSGDWGELSAEDILENEVALQAGCRLFSSYAAKDGTIFWIITEADRMSTTVMLPEDY
jgi:hypothetical protein